jgi:protein O-mannosyl-transferase
VRLALACLTVAVYAVALTSPFQFDDRGAIVRELSVHSLSAAAGALAHGLRALLKLSYAVSWALGAGETWPFHAFNLLVHLVNVELVMRLYTAATRRQLSWPFAELMPGGVVAGVLFALHPIQTEAVTYVTGRSASLSTGFMLLALAWYVAGARSGRRKYRWLLAPLAFVLAMATKETSALLPLILLAWELTVEQSPLRVAVGRLALWFAVWPVAAVALIMHPRYFQLLYNALGQRPFVEAVQYQLAGVAYIARRLVLWDGPCIDPGLWLARPAGGLVYGTAALLGLALAWALLRARARPLVLFGFLLFLLQLLLVHALLPRVDVINERHAYLANVGLCLAVGSLVRGLKPWLWLLAAVLAALSVRRNLDYQTEVALWQSTVRAAPSNPRAHNNLGVAYELEGQLVRARVEYAEALKLEPRYAAARENLTRALRR